MRSYSFIVFCVIAALVAVIYIGGGVQVAGEPVFSRIDRKFGTTAFMGSYHKLMSVFRKKESAEKKEDPWTKTYQDFGKVLRNTVE